jgi:uncharacterized protein (TIGR02466 family)
MENLEYFKTPMWVEEKPKWVKPLNKLCDVYIKDAKDLNKDKIEKKGSDFGIVHHSYELTGHTELKKYHDYIGGKSWEFLDWMGYDLKNHSLVFKDFWVQEFPKDGGGNHNSHIHSNNHVSGFFYLKVDKDGSVPVFHDPRPASVMSALPEKNEEDITYASKSFYWKPKPGTLIIMPAYLNHEYVVSRNDPFRFIHFNLQAIDNRFIKN